MTEFTGGPGFAAFVATFVMVGLTIVLMRSLNKQLRKVRTSRADEALAMGSDDSSGIKKNDRDGDEVTGESRDR